MSHATCWTLSLLKVLWDELNKCIEILVRTYGPPYSLLFHSSADSVDHSHDSRKSSWDTFCASIGKSSWSEFRNIWSCFEISFQHPIYDAVIGVSSKHSIDSLILGLEILGILMLFEKFIGCSKYDSVPKLIIDRYSVKFWSIDKDLSFYDMCKLRLKIDIFPKASSYQIFYLTFYLAIWLKSRFFRNDRRPIPKGKYVFNKCWKCLLRHCWSCRHEIISHGKKRSGVVSDCEHVVVSLWVKFDLATGVKCFSGACKLFVSNLN